jgi:hypothetical protein
MAQGTHLYFVTWPDGKVDEESVNVASEQIAIARMIRTWLPEHIFGQQSWLNGQGGYLMNQVWTGMKEKGFKVHALEVPATPRPATPGGPTDE